MNHSVEVLNGWGESFSAFAWPMLWQSSLLIAVIFAFDVMFARRIRASVRYALWMVVLVKLLLPPALTLPTSATWWLWRPHPVVETPAIKDYTVSFGNSVFEALPPATVPVVEPPPKLSGDAWVLLAMAAMGVELLSWLAFRWLSVAVKVRRAATAPAELDGIREEARQLAGLLRRLRLKLIDDRQSPAVYGLFRPVILLPRTLANQLSVRQLRAVLLHEAIHLRRGDVWVNFAQTLLQIAYWWHPLLWLANARIRRVREEAVDDAVMLALRDGADAYAPTLLEVAKFAFRRPLASLGLIGILESRSALRQRVERLVDFQPSRRAGLSVLSLCGIFAFSAVALPMGQGPERITSTRSSGPVGSSSVTTDGVPADVTVTREKVSSGHTNTNSKSTLNLAGLDLIHLDQFGPFQHATLSAVIDKLSMKDPNNIPFLIASGLLRGNQTLIDLPKLTNVALSDVLDAIVRGANQPIRYYCMDRFIVFSPVTEPNNLNYELFNPLSRTKVFVSLDTISNVVLFTSVRRNAIYHKLNQIQLDVSFHDLPLSEVLRELREVSLKRDPRKQGIIFLFNPHIEEVSSAGIPINPKTGLPIKAAAALETADPSQININLNLKNVSLQDVLNAICLASDHPIKYSVEDYGIVFSIKGTNAPQYEVRTFRINPDAFVIPKLKYAVGYNGSSDDRKDVVKMAKQLFSTLGVTFDPPKTVFYNDRLGALFVYATPQDLKVIENAIEDLSDDPPQVHIKARFFEVPKRFFSSADASSLPSGMTNGGILTAAERAKVLRLLESQNGAEELAEPEATTLSGRQTQMRATITQPIITNFTFEASAGAIAGTAEPYGRFSDGSRFVPQTIHVEVGPILDVVSDVLSDGNTINLTTIASRIEFLGYSTSRGLVRNITTNAAGTGFSPVFSASDAVLSKNIWDGQTLVLFPKYKVLSDGKTKDRISKAVEEKNRNKVEIVLVTATLIDEAGNRINSNYFDYPDFLKPVPGGQVP